MNTNTRQEHEEQRQLIRNSAISFAEKESPLGRLRDLRSGMKSFDRAMWQKMAELGWTGLLIPESAGGMGLTLADMAVVAEELGTVLAPEPLLESAVHAALILSAAAEHDKAAQVLVELAGGTIIPVVAWQETGGGLNPQTVNTSANKCDGGYALTGQKTEVPLGADADGFLVPAILNDKTALFWVASNAPGVSITRHNLAGIAHHATVNFEGVTLEEKDLLLTGGDAIAALERSLDATRIATANYLLGLMRSTLDMTLDYLRTREQFKRPIGSFQALQHRAVNLFIQREVTQAVATEAALAFDDCDDATGRALLASRAKHRATEAAQLITRDAVQMHGAIGFTDECDVGLYLDRATVLAAYLGNASWNRRRVSNQAPYIIEPVSDVPDENAPGEPTDKNWNAMSDDDFRAMVRAWYTAECPPDMRNRPARPHWHEVKDWYLKLSAKGWLAPAWPAEYGGMGLAPAKLLILFEEQERLGIARAPDQGIIMVGPLIINYGTEEQRSRYLPKILAGEHIWCQGYSEPNAGSDLASLRTEAVLDGDEFVINGSKTWTTLAQDATHIFVLARTDKNVKSQKGISFLLVDIEAPGVTVRPIRTIAGHEEFCEVFFDNVRTPADDLVGGINNGWTIAKALLGFERIVIGSPKQPQFALQRLAELADGAGLFADAVFTDQFTRLRLDVLDLESIYAKFADIVKAGGKLGADVSLLKIWASETVSRLSELMLDAAGTRGAEQGKISFGDAEIDIMSMFYNTRPTTIYGGANEIQRNILSKNVLRLPDA